jgi:uncharacterized protein YmfQ (DUF2313 family)
MAANFTAGQYAQAMRALLPRGRVWNHEDGSSQALTVDGLAQVYAQNDGDAVALLTDAFPATAVNLLPEWESSLGLPDLCIGPAPTIQTRQALVVSRLTNSGGQSVPYFTAFAQAIGYSILIKEFTPFRLGAQRMGSPLGGPEWAYAWQVEANLTAPVPFRMGLSRTGDPLVAWTANALECEFGTLKPAHSLLTFQYIALLAANTSLQHLLVNTSGQRLVASSAVYP